MVCNEWLEKYLHFIYSDPNKIETISSFYNGCCDMEDFPESTHEKIDLIHNLIACGILARMTPNPDANVELEYHRLLGAADITPIIFDFLEERFDVKNWKDVMHNLSLELHLRNQIYIYHTFYINKHIDRLKDWRNHGISKPKVKQKKKKFKKQIDFYEDKLVDEVILAAVRVMEICSEFRKYFDGLLEIIGGFCIHQLRPYSYVNYDVWCSICEKYIDVGFGCLECDYYQCKECHSKAYEIGDVEFYHGVTRCDYCEKKCVDNWFRCPCKEPRYCSRRCQKKDWKYHRDECTCRVVQSDVGEVKI